MKKINEDIIKAVTEAARIEDVVGDFMPLRRAGVNLTGLCPFHDDRHDGNFIVRPSTISADRGGNSYRCFTCDKRGNVVKFLMEAERMTFPDAIRYLGRKYCIEVDDVPLNWIPPPPRPTPPPLPVLEIPRRYVSRTMEIARETVPTLTQWLRQLPWSDEQRTRLDTTLWQYCVGGWRDGRVAFWLIDHEGVPRTAKLMKYQADGHRDKQAHPSWLHNQDGVRDRLKPDDHTIRKPLFGSHLLRRYPQAAVNIVESEKTALIMANFYGMDGRQLWLACGGLSHLRMEAMQPLIDQERQVWLWPDRDGVMQWGDVAEKLGSDSVKVYTQFLDTFWLPEDGDKADCADITIRMLRNPEWKPERVAVTQQQTEQQQVETSAERPDGVSDEEWREHMKLMQALNAEVATYGDEPFTDMEEMYDPRVRQWREALRNSHRPNITT